MRVNDKKLLYIITKSNFGGAQRYVFENATAMVAQGYEVAVAAGGQGELVERLQTAGISVFTIAGAQRDIAWRQEINVVLSLFKIIRNFHPNIVHLNSSKIGVLGSLVARACNVERIVFTAHGWPFMEPRSLWWRAMAWAGSYLTALLVHRIITVSAHDKAIQRMPLCTKKTHIIAPALTPFSVLSRDEARLALVSTSDIAQHASHIWIGTIGELTHNKNHSTLIDAIATFNATRHTKLFLMIIGEGELRPALTEQIEMRGEREQIVLLGHVPEARQYLRAFDLFILPSHKEGLPYALLEAGAVGLPCIASRVGGIPEIIAHEVSGLLINPDNPREIEETIELLINEPDLRTNLATQLTETVTERFSPDASIKALSALYQQT